MIHLLLVVIYLAFIGLGLPDALLGAAWPTMYPQFDMPVSYMGFVSITISIMTVISSLQCDRLIRKFGAGKLTAFSTAMTAAAMVGFTMSTEYWMLFVWAIPFGLGAGCVDSALNNYVAIHYKSWHMSWLHCMWGVGAAIGPYLMGLALTSGHGWNRGYFYVFAIQATLALIIFISLPIWKQSDREEVEKKMKTLSLKEILKIPGTKSVMILFFCYCALEQTAGLWASSYLVLSKGITEEVAARFGSLFYIGITVGRAISGFISMKLNDRNMIRLGSSIIIGGIAIMFLPFGKAAALAGLLIIGLGCAPIYPCVIHSTPIYFGADKSQSIIGVQMASAYVGNCLMPPLFGIIANHISISLLPFYLLLLIAGLIIMHENLCKVCRA